MSCRDSSLREVGGSNPAPARICLPASGALMEDGDDLGQASLYFYDCMTYNFIYLFTLVDFSTHLAHMLEAISDCGLYTVLDYL
jgi:hypothetical protein